MAEKANDGHPQHRPPFGYQIKQKILVINKNEVEIVKAIFINFLRGINRYQLAHKYKKSFQTITNILHNPIYSGFIQWNKKIIKGKHEAIISKKIFKKAQTLLKNK